MNTMKNKELCEATGIYCENELIDIVFRVKEHQEINDGYVYGEYRLSNFIPGNLTVREFCDLINSFDFGFLATKEVRELNVTF